MFEKIVGFLIRFRIPVLVLMALVTVFLAAQVTRMEMFTQFLDLFP
jgi:hypothetical protein